MKEMNSITYLAIKNCEKMITIWIKNFASLLN